MKHNIQVIFSDLFGVLIGPDYSDLINYINLVTGESKKNIYKHVFNEESMHFIRGEISFPQYFSKVQYNINKGNNIDQKKFSYFWKQMKIGEMPAANALLKIKHKYKIYIITNTTTAHVNSISHNFNFINEFNGVVTSNMARAHKPSKEIFNYAYNYANIKEANKAVFIDDSKLNILAASNLGMITHQYTNYDVFLDFLNTF